MFAPICREIFTLSFEIMVILDWTSPLRIFQELFKKCSGINQCTRWIQGKLYKILGTRKCSYGRYFVISVVNFIGTGENSLLYQVFCYIRSLYKCWVSTVNELQRHLSTYAYVRNPGLKRLNLAEGVNHRNGRRRCYFWVRCTSQFHVLQRTAGY